MSFDEDDYYIDMLIKLMAQPDGAERGHKLTYGIPFQLTNDKEIQQFRQIWDSNEGGDHFSPHQMC